MTDMNEDLYSESNSQERVDAMVMFHNYCKENAWLVMIDSDKEVMCSRCPDTAYGNEDEFMLCSECQIAHTAEQIMTDIRYRVIQWTLALIVLHP